MNTWPALLTQRLGSSLDLRPCGVLLVPLASFAPLPCACRGRSTSAIQPTVCFTCSGGFVADLSSALMIPLSEQLEKTRDIAHHLAGVLGGDLRPGSFGEETDSLLNDVVALSAHSIWWIILLPLAQSDPSVFLGPLVLSGRILFLLPR